MKSGDRVRVRRLVNQFGQAVKGTQMGAKERLIPGTVVQVVDRYAVVQFRHYRECFWLDELVAG